ncbi:hypothetical protein [Flavobacterium limnophilum]|uniref:hypothetical protein n=1 Tax=Flavobacterium limnophilum TaxID=3003262 RepID=UPI002482A29F|nr:hypothetical protein [Flavobacterium limnophilum]
MRKSLIHKVSTTLLTLIIVTLLSTSCSSDDEKDPIVVFTSLSANKTDAFIEETIVLNLEGTGFSDVNVASNNTSVKIIKVTPTIYEISSTVATSTNIYISLSNNTYKENKSISLNFCEHGVKNYKTVEGITVDTDKSSKVITLLGEPDTKTTSTDGLSEYWKYASKGLCFIITKSSLMVNQIEMFSSYYYHTNSANTQVLYTNYPHEIGNGWKINNTTTMDTIITLLGIPTTKSSSSTNRMYQYSSQRIVFRFFSNSEDDYTGKKIIYFSVY